MTKVLIEGYDHFCPWSGTVIGKKNMLWFQLWVSTLVLALASVTTLFMSYFAIEAVRTENRYQLAAYAVTTAVFLYGYVPPLLGSSDSPMHVHMNRTAVRNEVHSLVLAAFVCTCTLQLCARVQSAAPPAPTGSDAWP